MQESYRVTFPGAYGPGTPGHTDAGSRQGHYPRARNAREAVRAVFETAEGDRAPTRTLDVVDVQAWPSGYLIGTFRYNRGAVEQLAPQPKREA